MALNLDDALGTHVRALEFRSQRAQLLATNIANADTPNYKAVDMDFRTALSKARSADLPLKVTNDNQIQSNNSEGSKYKTMYRIPMQPTLDGNTVDTEVEKAAFARNAVQYQATLTFLDGQIKGILSAIKGQ